MNLSQQAQDMVNFWNNTRNIPFKGQLISIDNGVTCMCAQGQTLYRNGYTVEQLKNMNFHEADEQTARILKISVSHSVLLRYINDTEEGSPQEVLSNPEKYLGPNYEAVLEFWLKLDGLTEDQLKTITSRYWDFRKNSESEWDRASDEAFKASKETIGVKFANDAAAAAAAVGWAAWGANVACRATQELIGDVPNKVFHRMFDDL